jgi:hypothetical protein
MTGEGEGGEGKPIVLKLNHAQCQPFTLQFNLRSSNNFKAFQVVVNVGNLV